jgi:hypothetical protein
MTEIHDIGELLEWLTPSERVRIVEWLRSIAQSPNMQPMVRPEAPAE